MQLQGPVTQNKAKEPNTTTWIWKLHVDAHDFDGHTSDLEEIFRKVFSTHFDQVFIIFLWLSGYVSMGLVFLIIKHDLMVQLTLA